jgi:hypothetical protein
MCGVAYSHGSNMAVGAVAGALSVGALGYGVAAGTMIVVTLSAVLSGLPPYGSLL